MHKKNKIIKISKVVILLVFISILLVKGINLYNKNKINLLLKTDNYSYLPIEAKEYLKEVYEKTGEIILTEKNKQENVPYLNPQYVEYLTYSEEEKKEISLIPTDLILDYTSVSLTETNEGLEEYYNSSDPNNNYTTPMKNQSNLGICWAHAITENAESFLMTSKNETYEEGVTEVFSPRQLDYATSFWGIKEYINKYGQHSLGGGSNFGEASNALAVGISLYDTNWKYNNSYTLDELELIEVLDENLAKYELDSTIDMPILNIPILDFDNTEHLKIFNEYINQIKKLIKLYGGPYVATQAPLYSCSAINYYDNGKYIIDVDGTCEEDGPHSMQIVGWDDNYQYKYCIEGTKHKLWDSSCSKENTISGKGAWILRNSWGEANPNKYTYLAYDSYYTEYNFITALDEMGNKKWQYQYNNYNNNIRIEEKRDIYSDEFNYTISLLNGFDVDSNIVKIKYKNRIQNGDFKIYISQSGDDNDFELIQNLSTVFPGFVTLNLIDDNYKINNNSKIKIVSNHNIDKSSISIFTTENTENKYILTKDLVYQQSSEMLKDGLYQVYLFSDTYNIKAGSKLTYQLFDQKGENITTQMKTENNIVSNNMVNTVLNLPDIGDDSYYIVKILYEDKIMSTVKLSVEIPKPAVGSGTEEDPFVILSSKDLYLINYNLDAHFVLGADIDLTYDTQNENGLYYNNGNGWTAIGYEEKKVFSGSLNGYYNGEYHKIIGMKSSSIGLIYYVSSDTSVVNLKNIIFEKAIINDSNLLAHTVVAFEQGKVNIENIAAIDCIFSGNSNGLVANLKSYGKDAIVVNNIFNNGTFNEENQTINTLAWGAETYEDYTSEASIKISNVQMLGRINNTNSYYYNLLIRFISGDVKVSNIILNNYASNSSSYLTSRMTKSTGEKMPELKNIYYLKSIKKYFFSDTFYVEENVENKNISDLKNLSNYENWDKFDINWTMKSDDESGRIPILKFVPFEYTTISDINIKVGEKVNLYDYVRPNNDAAKNLLFDKINDEIISVAQDGTITGLQYGTSKINVLSQYDGFEDEVVVNVIDDNKVIIRFDSNEGNNVEQIIDKGKTIILNKNTFVKEGYKFKEWNTKVDGTGTSYSDEAEVTLNENLMLYAQWNPIKYQIRFNSNDGQNNTHIQTLEYDNRYILDNNTFVHQNEKYYFKNWNTEKDGTGISYQNCESIFNLTNVDEQIINLYAIWETKQPIISFDANGGVGTMVDMILNLGEKTKLSENKFTKEGYKFGHWNTEPDDSGTSYYNQKEVSLTADLRLYAIWYPIQYYVYWYDENGENKVIGSNYYDSEYEIGDYKWTLVDGYKFKEWNTKIDGTGLSYHKGDKFKNLISTNNGKISLYAIIQPITYEINYNSNNSFGIMENQRLSYDIEYNLLKNVFTKPGYIFKEWNTKADGTGIPYIDEQKVKNLTTKDNDIINLYAIWESDSYSVTFDANGGTFKDNQNIITIENWNNDLLETLEAPVKEGHIFKGFYTETTGGTSIENYIAEAGINQDGLIFYAQWEKEKYTLTFDSNGGSGSMLKQTFDYNSLQKINKNTFTKSGYKFINWNTRADGSGTYFSDEQEITINQNIKLYAMWEEAYSYKINKYLQDDINKYIDNIDINTTLDEYKKNIELNTGYTLEVETKTIKEEQLLYTGSKTRIYKDNNLFKEYTNIIRGEATGDGKINYLDYVSVYNHIVKTKNPSSNKTLLENEYLLAADMSGDNKISYLDYVYIYDKIKELKGGNN